MKNELFKGNGNQLPDEGLAKSKPSQKYTWIAALVKAIVSAFCKQSEDKSKVNYKRTEITKDRIIQEEFTYKRKQTSKD